MSDPDFIESQLFQYESLGFIRHVEEKPLSAVMSNRMCLVVNGSQNLNGFIIERNVKLSHLQVANQHLSPGQHFATCDLESGYHQIPIHPDHQHTLGIKWKKNGKTVYFV